MSNKFSEKAKIAGAITIADIVTPRSSTVFQSVAGYDRLTGVGVSSALASGKKMTVQLRQATDANGTGAKNLGTAKVGDAQQREVMADARVEDMDHVNGFTFVGVQVSATDNGTAVNGSGLVILDQGRFSEE